ncbi:serine/threonine protein kinase [Actinosynnema sp. CS-041913]|uniref:serine/threonine protein kinase n=1 Tax=Actinosynnema sp. CS-041913 TaxID=3239917 RepID=UPI003D92FB2F
MRLPTAETADTRGRGYGLMGVDAGGAVVDPRVLAAGPVATVYAARLAATGAEIAVKVFADRFDRDTTAWLDRERQALAAVPVRTILPVDGLVDLPDGRSGVRMELCRGSLAQALAVGKPTVRDVFGIGWVIAGALAAAHRAGVVHGGVTPHNVLYRRSGELVVADFGLALREPFPRDPTHALEYTSPETLRDDTRSAASDLYGLGAVLHAALTGAPPFPRRTGEPPGERILRVLREQVPPVRGAGVPAELSDVVGRLLAKDPAARPPDADGVARLFEHLLRMTNPHAVPPTAPLPPVPAPAPTHESVPVQGAAPETDDSDTSDPGDFDFDAFASQPKPPTPATGRTLVHSTDATAPTTRSTRRRTAVWTGLGAAFVAGLITVPLVIGQDGQTQPTSPATAAEEPQPPPGTLSAAPGRINLVLDPPTDRGSHVELSWRADGDLDFAVVVAGEFIDTMVLTAHRQHNLRVPVDPTRRYCFQVRATDGRHIYTSEPVPVRGAECGL